MKYWLLEIILNKKPDKKIIKPNLNFLAKQFKLKNIMIMNEKNNDKEFLNKIYSYQKIINKDWLKENRNIISVYKY